MRHNRPAVLALCVALAMTALSACSSGNKNTSNFSQAPGASSERSRPSSRREEEPDYEESAKLNVSLGQAYLAKGQLELAMEKLKKAVLLNPKSSDAHTLLGVLYEQINKDKLAEEHYVRALKLTPETGASNNNMGRFLCARQRFAEADKNFIAALADPFYKNPETALLNRATCAMRWGKRDIAEESLRKVLQTYPENTTALLQMALLAFEDKQFMRARAFLERHLSGAPAAPDTLMLGLKVETQLGDRRAVERYRRRLMAEFPNSEQAVHAAKATQTP
ncbi:MAG: type IV pilus biogenesis/stability protein PilW [Pseudomonadota bacterium]|nr:type IV pilus biogenesis/stability protein PilW [Pseudomonadota bacterium]